MMVTKNSSMAVTYSMSPLAATTDAGATGLEPHPCKCQKRVQ